MRTNETPVYLFEILCLLVNSSRLYCKEELKVYKMNDTTPPPSTLIKYLLIAGWICLVLSSFLLYQSIQLLHDSTGASDTSFILMMTFARLCGVSAFVIAIAAIFERQWTAGGSLLVASIVLPIISLFVHGTM